MKNVLPWYKGVCGDVSLLFDCLFVWFFPVPADFPGRSFGLYFTNR